MVGGFKFEPNSSQRSNTGPGATGERHRGARRALNTQPAASKPNSRRKGHLATCVKRSPLRLRDGSLRYGWLIAPLQPVRHGATAASSASMTASIRLTVVGSNDRRRSASGITGMACPWR